MFLSDLNSIFLFRFYWFVIGSHPAPAADLHDISYGLMYHQFRTDAG
ncbi:hypothetical protein PRABACTJOHN_03271 [Parabacteroides johnsonii DSM 18315]|uniref:Uncharacterized protein n=1 Tax=Parabacteroides johnsonii DSM 18315 TaxID=537006 RepID=B7BDZ5_9BACT|nr:hypothetical protein PRABACTJOHN_03271 [Parabacteroides johnsonii DSM 18315]